MSTTNSLPKRDAVPVGLTWDLGPMYSTDQDWESEFTAIASLLPKLQAFKGKLKKASGKKLLEALGARDEISRRLSKLYVYASLRQSQDTKNSLYAGMADRVATLATQFSAAASYFTPELMEIPTARLSALMLRTKGLRVYHMEFAEIDRQRAHVRSAEVEELLSQAGELTGLPGTVHDMLDNADMKLPAITVGQELVQITDGNYNAVLLSHPDVEVRRDAFRGMMGAFKGLENTMAATYAGQVKADIFSSKARRYSSCLAKKLDGDNVPVSVYENLIKSVHQNLPVLHRYLDLRRRLLGVDELHMYDLYVPLVGSVDFKVSYEKAKELVLAAVQPLGPEYVSVLKKGFADRWVDVVENQNKKSGAFSSGCYDSFPYMQLNWHDSLEWTYTLAHEAGHSMHSFFTRRAQPYQTGDYTIFVAEVASTLNEALLTDHLLKTTQDKAVRMYIINKAMESIRQTMFRQTLFAEFEMIAHAKAEAGEALTPELLNGIHKGLNDKYYGAAVVVDPEVESEWSRIPHFYSPFYVFQYATGIAAANALCRQILSEGEPAVKRYLNFLSSGSSDYSLNLLKGAGVDLNTATPVEQTLAVFADYLAEFERLALSQD